MDFETPKVMGILNVTPDSFYDGGKFTREDTILRQVEKMLDEGAHFIDVGGYSSRPNAEAISLEEEAGRAIPAVRAIKRKFPDAIISIDTFRSEVARRAADEGASIVNDISGGEQDPDMFALVATLQLPYVLMHMRGTPETMATMTHYDNLIKEITDYFQKKLFQLHQMGVSDVIIDPGFGFAKTIEQNFEMLSHLEYFRILGQPLLVGISRKSMVWKTLGTSSENALNGTSVLHAAALLKGASILRAHDVKEAMECVRLFNRLNS